MMQMAHRMKSGMSDSVILNNFLSVSIIARAMGIMAIENLKKSNVVWSIPFWVNVRTNMPLDPNMKPARMGKIKYNFLMLI